MVFDNSGIESELICEKENNNDILIHNQEKFRSLKSNSK
jgi:hypothetical protein